MITPAMSRRAEELSAEGAAFVVATVVRAQHPTSVEAGNVALVLGDGTIEGFVGGVCTEHSVRAYSLQAIESGESVLLRILPFSDEGEPGGDVTAADGAVTVQNPCLSGGAIEVFLEPTLPELVLVPMNPFALTVRPIVLNPGVHIRIVLAGNAASVTTDGYLNWSARAGDELLVAAYSKRLKVVRFRGPEEFYRLLRQKIGWGAPLVPRPHSDVDAEVTPGS